LSQETELGVTRNYTLKHIKLFRTL